MTKSTLDTRIAEAIRTGTSASISALMPDVECAATAAADKAEAARTRALDPLLASKEIAEARTESENERFTADRLTAAADRLRQALADAQKAEHQVEMVVVGKAVRKQTAQYRDELVKFEETAAALAGHAENIVALRREIAEKNAKLQAGNRADLVATNPLSQAARATGQLIVDPLAGLAIAGLWPHIRPKSLALAKAG